ncbi:MAG: MFS transporter [Deltaproteobacteria bacterium]|nr:MFS transporter [Deltaproteobacteria bacterium]
MQELMINVSNRKVILIITCIAGFLGSITNSSVTVALPTIGREFAMEAVLLGWVITISTLAMAVASLPAGRLADIYGMKKAFLLGMCLFTVSSFFCNVTSSSAMLISARFFQGIGISMSASCSVAILTAVFPAEERGKSFGIFLASVYGGGILGPFLGGLLTQHFGWRSIFSVTSIFGAAEVILTLCKIKGEWAGSRGEKFDAIGSAVMALAMVVLMYGFTVVTTVTGISFLITGILGMIGFVLWESRVDSPLINMNLMRRNRVFMFSNLATLIQYSSVYAVIFLMSLYLQYAKGFSPQKAGSILIIQSGVMTVFALFSGRLSDRVQPQKIAASGLALNCLMFFLLSFLNEETSVLYVIAGLGFFGAGIGLFSSPNTNAIMGSVEKRFHGIASASVATMRSTGQMLSMGIVMILFSVFIGERQITPDYYPQFMICMKTGYLIFSVLCFLGVLAQLCGRKHG